MTKLKSYFVLEISKVHEFFATKNYVLPRENILKLCLF